MNTIEKLDKLAELEEATEKRKAELDHAREELINSILTPEIKQQINDINEEFAPKYLALETDETALKIKGELAFLREEISQETIKAGKTIKGTRKMAVLTPEKEKDTTEVNVEMLKGLALNIPKIKECFREVKTIEPAKVVIRKI